MNDIFFVSDTGKNLLKLKKITAGTNLIVCILTKLSMKR